MKITLPPMTRLGEAPPATLAAGAAAPMARAGKQKGSAHPNVEAAVRGWQNHEYADTGAAMDALERGNSHLYEEMYPDVDAKTVEWRRSR